MIIIGWAVAVALGGDGHDQHVLEGCSIDRSLTVATGGIPEEAFDMTCWPSHSVAQVFAQR